MPQPVAKPWVKTIDDSFKHWLYVKTGCSVRWDKDEMISFSGPVAKWEEALQIAKAHVCVCVLCV